MRSAGVAIGFRREQQIWAIHVQVPTRDSEEDLATLKKG